MQGEEFDELLDNLPWHLRNKVLTYDPDAVEDEFVIRKGREVWLEQTAHLERVLWWTLLPFVYLWAMVVGLIGLLLIWVPIIGLPLIALAGWPGALHMAWRVKRSIK